MCVQSYSSLTKLVLAMVSCEENNHTYKLNIPETVREGRQPQRLNHHHTEYPCPQCKQRQKIPTWVHEPQEDAQLIITGINGLPTEGWHWALSPTSLLTNCVMVEECSVIQVSFSKFNLSNLPHLFEAWDISSSINVHHYIFWRFCLYSITVLI